jgi:hypothetical protein
MDEVLYRLLQDTVVLVLCEERGISGTGCLVAPATVLTAAHAVRPETHITVRWRRSDYAAEILGVWDKDDQGGRNAALLKIKDPPGDHPCVYLHESIRPADTLYTFGFPRPPLSDRIGGESFRFECEGMTSDPTLIKFAGGQVHQGMGGSPLLNERTGAVCGIVISTFAIDSPRGGLAIPVTSLFETFPDLQHQQQIFHKANTEWIRLLGTAQEYDKSLTFNNIVIPGGYRKLIEPLEALLGDHRLGCSDYAKNVFIMSRFQPGNKTLESIDKTIRAAVQSVGLIGHRADDRCYPTDRNLWDNVCTYMIGCKFGIAVLENILQDEFNPNVALEYGFMRALGKPTLLLKEK